MMTLKVKAPSWVQQALNKRGTVLKLTGNGSWKGQPVINRLKVRLTDEVTGVKFNKMMQAEYRIKGTTGRDKVVFGDQAGSITKRGRTVIDFKEDSVRDKFIFKNSVPGKPFNHMQRIRIKNFGREDVIRLKNIGRKFKFDDLVRAGVDRYVLPGVSPLSLEVFVS